MIRIYCCIGKVPTLSTSHGGIFESNSIARYIARLNPSAHLYGKSNHDQSYIDSWLDYTINEIEPVGFLLIGPLNGYVQYNVKAHNDALVSLNNVLTLLNTYLTNNTYFVGHSVTLADIVIFTSLHDLYKRIIPTELQQKYQAVTRWFNLCLHTPEFQSVIGTQFKFATVEEQVPGAADKGKKPAAADKPAKVDKPVAAAAAVPNDAQALEDSIAAEAKKKPKSKLDLLPDSKMDLDTVKRTAFLVRPFNPDFWTELQGMWDNAGWSWWTAHYKYNDENKVLYMTSNLMGGFIQRCDSVRKYSMGVMNIIGNVDEETPPFSVVGAFLFRGHEIPDEMLIDNPDSEYYTWNRIEFNEQGINTLKQYFQAESINNENVLDRRFMK